MNKFYPYLLSVCLFFSFQFSNAQSSPSAGLPDGIKASWFQDAQQVITNMQYSMVRLANGKYSALNPAQHSLFEIGSKGYKQTGINNDKRVTPLSISLSAINSVKVKDQAYEAVHKDQQLDLHYRRFTIQYENTAAGLRQNFIIHERPKSSCGHLSLSLDVVSDLSIVVNEGKSGISLVDKNGKTQLYYDDLNVWDANGKSLTARMELEPKGTVAIIVEDKLATYPITIDPLNHAPAWTDNGTGLVFPLLDDLSVPLLYGYSVSAAGDVNGDGYGDIIVGSPFYVDIINIQGGTFNALAVGAAFLYYGSATGPSATPSEVLQPTSQVGALFGFSVSKAGDLNGDGYGDIVIGAPGDRISLSVGVIPVSTSVSTGRVYTYYGGPAGNFDGNANTEPAPSKILAPTQADFGTLLTVPASPLYGYSVSEAGDVNGDGFGDVVVGSPGYLRLLPLPLRAGRVDVFTGSAAGLSSTPTSSIAGAVLNATFGFSVSTAGDTNKDGFSDIIVGAPGGITLLSVGQAFVFNGSAAGTSTSPSVTLTASGVLPTLFGFSVSNAGDVNGDGFADVIVGEPASLENLLTQTVAVGGASIFYGGSSGITTAGNTRLQSPRRPSLLGLLQGNLLFGYSVSTAGDINCDGLSDVIVGEPGGTSLSLGSGLLGLVSTNVLGGQTYIYSGSNSSMASLPFYTIRETGSVTGANLIGHSVSDAGDVNGDGKNDLLVGAPNGTLNLSSALAPVVGDVINLVTTATGGSSSIYSGCLTPTFLPVTLLTFQAQKSGEDVVMNWKTAGEINFSHYQVERSADGISFTTINTVSSEGSEGENAYQYIDSLPAPLNYYRLKMIDIDGGKKYSAVRIVNFAQKHSNVSIALSPNPARTQFSVSLAGIEKGDYELRIHNMSGVVVDRKILRTFSQTNVVSVSRNSLPGGLYMVTLCSASGATLASSRLVLQ